MGFCGKEEEHGPHGPKDARRCAGTEYKAVFCGDFTPHDPHKPSWRAENYPCPGLDPDETGPHVVVTTIIDRLSWDTLGPRAKQIITGLIPEFVNLFVDANLHYGDDNPAVLGPAGQFSDIWRKIGPLRRALWEGQELTRESARQILMDLIGHSLLTIELLDSKCPRTGRIPEPLTALLPPEPEPELGREHDRA